MPVYGAVISFQISTFVYFIFFTKTRDNLGELREEGGGNLFPDPRSRGNDTTHVLRSLSPLSYRGSDSAMCSVYRSTKR